MEPSRTSAGSQGDPVEELMVACLALPEEEREAAIERACSEHPELAEELRARWSTLAAMGLGATPAVAEDGFPEQLGDFRLVERLGGGGMGVVYRAEQRSLSREVALKLMRPESLYFPKARERFRREVEAVAKLEHPHVVPVHAVGEEAGVPFFAMPLLEGATLADALARLEGSAPEDLSGADLARAVEAPDEARRAGVFDLSWADACTELARQVAEALQHAHERGIVHRDVKPSNVALTRDGRARLFDFGLAVTQEVDRLTQTGGQLGTLQYMSPEQLHGERELDARTDVYALGVTLYELVGLQPAFEGPTRTSVEARILDGRPRPLRELNRRVPPELELVCRKAMDPDPARRYASAREVAEELERVLQRRPVLARPPGAVLRARRWSQRHPALAVGLVAAVGLFVVAPSVLLWRERRHSRALMRSLEAETQALAAERTARAAEQEALAEARTTVEFLERVFLQQAPETARGRDVLLVDAIFGGADQIAILGGFPVAQARLLRSLGTVLTGLSANAEAADLLGRAVEVEERHGIVGGQFPGDLRHGLAVSLSNLGQYERAAEEALRALEELEEADLGTSHHAAEVSMTVGVALLYQRRFPEAEEALRAAFDSLRQAGESAFHATMSGVFLVSAVKEQGRIEEAVEVVDELEGYAETALDADHPLRCRVLDHVAWARARRGDVEGALLAGEEALRIAEEVFGPRSFDALDAMTGLVDLQVQAGDLPLALDLAQAALELSIELQGPNARSTQVLRSRATQIEAALAARDR